MSEINWDDNAKAAVREFYRWANARFKSGSSVDADAFLREFTEQPQQTKTVADEQEGEKWTHVDDEGDKCCVVHTKDGLAWVSYERSICDCVVPMSDLKPIKPKLTKAQAWDLIQDYEGLDVLVRYILRLHEQYEII